MPRFELSIKSNLTKDTIYSEIVEIEIPENCTPQAKSDIVKARLEQWLNYGFTGNAEQLYDAKELTPEQV
jgi:hypothetical protein